MKKLLFLFAVLMATATSAFAAIPYQVGPWDPANLGYYLNLVIQAVNANVGNGSALPSSSLNLLDNGSMATAQRGTGIQTCGTTTIPSSAYSADRWGCVANVTSGAGRAQVTTSVPTPPAGFQQSQRLYRTSGALTQPVCMIQEMASGRATQWAGQNVVFSAYMQALAGLAADNASAANLIVLTGTGSDEGVQSWTASPAITPAWTGIATAANIPVTLTAAWSRYNTGAVAIPSTTTEIAVEICFTPTATGAGTTDGLAFTGAQLEPLTGTATTPGPFQFKQNETVELFRYFWKLSESAAVTAVAPCAAIDTTHTNCIVEYPAVMRAVPVVTYATGFATPTSTTQATLGACTTLAAAATVASTAPNNASALVTCTAGTVPAAGVASFLYSNGGTGSISISADF